MDNFDDENDATNGTSTSDRGSTSSFKILSSVHRYQNRPSPSAANAGGGTRMTMPNFDTKKISEQFDHFGSSMKSVFNSPSTTTTTTTTTTAKKSNFMSSWGMTGKKQNDHHDDDNLFDDSSTSNTSTTSTSNATTQTSSGSNSNSSSTGVMNFLSKKNTDANNNKFEWKLKPLSTDSLFSKPKFSFGGMTTPSATSSMSRTPANTPQTTTDVQQNNPELADIGLQGLHSTEDAAGNQQQQRPTLFSSPTFANSMKGFSEKIAIAEEKLSQSTETIKKSLHEQSIKNKQDAEYFKQRLSHIRLFSPEGGTTSADGNEGSTTAHPPSSPFSTASFASLSETFKKSLTEEEEIIKKHLTDMKQKFLSPKQQQQPSSNLQGQSIMEKTKESFTKLGSTISSGFKEELVIPKQHTRSTAAAAAKRKQDEPDNTEEIVFHHDNDNDDHKEEEKKDAVVATTQKKDQDTKTESSLTGEEKEVVTELENIMKAPQEEPLQPKPQATEAEKEDEKDDTKKESTEEGEGDTEFIDNNVFSICDDQDEDII